MVSRPERALRVQREHKEFLESFGSKARMGNVIELGGLFGGREALHEAIDDLGRHLFDVG